MDKVNTINWFFGRGLSIECNLTWTVPEIWKLQYPCISRETKISMIKSILTQEMNNVNCEIISDFLKILSSCTNDNYNHRFITTNWDYLLQREILNLGFTIKPYWLDDSHVYHLNGTIENLEDNTHRSPFLLEEDLANQRTSSREANKAYNKLIWDKIFVIVVMSFECETDRFFLNAVNNVEDHLAVGNSLWIVVNPDEDALNKTCERVQEALPSASVSKFNMTFNQWIQDNLKNFIGESLDKKFSSGTGL